MKLPVALGRNDGRTQWAEPPFAEERERTYLRLRWGAGPHTTLREPLSCSCPCQNSWKNHVHCASFAGMSLVPADRVASGWWIPFRERRPRRRSALHLLALAGSESAAENPSGKSAVASVPVRWNWVSVCGARGSPARGDTIHRESAAACKSAILGEGDVDRGGVPCLLGHRDGGLWAKGRRRRSPSSRSPTRRRGPCAGVNGTDTWSFG